MKQVTFTLRTLTPLFLAGADQTTAELRAPSFRGLMRYWYRALIGGMVGTTSRDLEKVMAAETAVFGATNRGSAVQVRISEPSVSIREFRKESRGRENVSGRDYLFWSMARSGSEEKKNLKEARWYFPPGTSFQVTLSARDAEIAGLKQAVATFWLLAQLGGIGSRSRRCAGSLAVQNVDDTLVPLPFGIARDADALKRQLEQGIRTAQELARELHKLEAHAISQAQFDILRQGACRIWILQDEQPWSSAEIAVQELGADLQDYRSNVPMTQRKIFGLPLLPMFRGQRRASPLLLRVAELQEKKYVGIAVLFKTTGRDVRIDDYRVIEKWIDAFRGKQEVRL